MFALNIRSIFGDTIDCRINGKPKRVTWRDEHTLVIEPDPYATAPVDTDKFGASWTGLEALASQLRGDCTQEEFARLTLVAAGPPVPPNAVAAAKYFCRKDRRVPVYSWFTEGFDTRDLKEAKALLDELNA